MKHVWKPPKYRNAAEHYQAGEQRLCELCGALQTLTREHSWGRVIRRQWLPLVGRCTGRKVVSKSRAKD